jgi:hypothetical protein
MNKRNRILAGLALSGAALVPAFGASAQAHAEPGLDQVADIGQPGGLMGLAAFTTTGLLTGVQPKIPDPQAMVDEVKQEKAKQDTQKSH